MMDGKPAKVLAPLDKTFKASLKELYGMLELICKYAKKIGFDNKRISQIELVCEEALVNIISYGFTDKEGEITLHCAPTTPTGIQIVILDGGIPFNPLKQPLKPASPPVEETPLGGYGVFFIVKLMDDVKYRRVKKMNELTLVKFL